MKISTMMYRYKNKRLLKKADKNLRNARLILGVLYGRIDWLDDSIIGTIADVDNAIGGVIDLHSSIHNNK